MSLFDLTGRVCFVTGAAKGLGFAMAEVAAEHGATVVLTDIDGDALTAAVQRLKVRELNVQQKIVDVADNDRITEAINETATQFGRLDIVFANAGLSAGPGPMTDSGAMVNVDMDRWNTLLQINLTSVFITLRAAAPYMQARRSGRMIVTSSIAGLRAERMVGYAYASTKAAVANLVKHAAMELAQYNITVNAIAPGPFRTDIGGGRLHRTEIAAEFARDIPLGRIAEPEEIKGLALLLASSASSYITGAVIPIDGGAMAT
jgi:NAD(P)-dependent dehydrogenase (short-subunit alcohol dehydrogenase family)